MRRSVFQSLPLDYSGLQRAQWPDAVQTISQGWFFYILAFGDTGSCPTCGVRGSSRPKRDGKHESRLPLSDTSDNARPQINRVTLPITHSARAHAECYKTVDLATDPKVLPGPMDSSVTFVPPAHQDTVQAAAPPQADSEKASEKVICSDVDGTRPPSLKDVDATVKTPAMRRKAQIQFATLRWLIFVAGWNDGTTGPLLPRLQEVYHVSLFYCLAFQAMLIHMRTTGRICPRLAHFRGQLRGITFTYDDMCCVCSSAAGMLS